MQEGIGRFRGYKKVDMGGSKKTRRLIGDKEVLRRFRGYKKVVRWFKEDGKVLGGSEETTK